MTVALPLLQRGLSSPLQQPPLAVYHTPEVALMAIVRIGNCENFIISLFKYLSPPTSEASYFPNMAMAEATRVLSFCFISRLWQIRIQSLIVAGISTHCQTELSQRKSRSTAHVDRFPPSFEEPDDLVRYSNQPTVTNSVRLAEPKGNLAPPLTSTPPILHSTTLRFDSFFQDTFSCAIATLHYELGISVSSSSVGV